MARNYNYESLSETIPVRETHQFDVDRFSEYMRDKIDGLNGLVDVVQMRAGQSNPTYLLKYGQQEYDFGSGVMFFISPNQVFNVEANDYSNQSGWVLLIHPDFLWNTSLLGTE